MSLTSTLVPNHSKSNVPFPPTHRQQEVSESLPERQEMLSAQKRNLDQTLANKIQAIQEEKEYQAALQRQLEKLERNRNKSVVICKKAIDEKDRTKLRHDTVGTHPRNKPLVEKKGQVL